MKITPANHGEFLQGCVKGYMTKLERISETELGNTVRHIAIFPDSTMKISKPHKSSGVHFNCKGWKWEPLAEMPEDCEYIGNYPANM